MIFWIMGGSCTGKKHFITRAVESPERMGFPAGLAAAWYEDGTTDRALLLEQLDKTPLIVRWQWGREHLLRDIAANRPDIRQELYLCRVYPSVQVARVVAREGSLKWDEQALIDEARNVRQLVERLSMDLCLPVRFIDTSREYPPEPPEKTPCASTA
jgi:hypothetical protein